MSNGYGGGPGQPVGMPPAGYGSPPAGYGVSPAGIPRPGSLLSAQGVDNTRQLAKWMKVFAIVNIVVGAFYCLSIAGVVIGWLPILMGWWKLKAAEDLLRFAEQGDTMALEGGIDRLRLYYMTIGIVTIVSLSLAALMVLTYLIIAIGMGVAIFGAAASGAGS